LAGLLQLVIFLLFGQTTIVDFVDKQLIGVLIVGNKFEVTVQLVHHTTFLN